MPDATVILGLNAAQLMTGLRAASSNVDKFAKGAKSSLSSAFSGGMMKGFLGAAGIGGIKTMMNQYDDLADAAIRLGESAETIQRVEFATNQLASVNIDGLVSSFLKLEKAMGDSENEDAVAALKKFGVTAESLSRMSLDEKILALRDAFSQAKTSGNGYNAMLDLFGKSAGNLIPIFEASREQIVGLMNDANAMSDSAVNNIAAMNDEMDGFLANTYAGAGALIAMITGVGKAAKTLAGGGASFADAMYEGFGSGDADAAAMKREDERKKNAAARAESAAKAAAEIAKKQKTQTYDIAKNIQEQANATSRLLAPYQQLLNYLDQQKQKQDQINSANKQSKQQSQSKIESQKNFAQSLEDEFKLLSAKASGDDKALKAMERELAIKERAKEIQQQMQVDAKTAMGIATQMQDMTEKAKDKSEGGADGDKRIQGYSFERQGGRDEARGRATQRAADSAEKRAGAYSRGFEGLDPAYARGDFGYFDPKNWQNADYEAGRYYKPQRPINPNASADAMKAPPSTSGPVVGSIQQLEQTIKALLTVD